ncbi:MAG: hypothetical protein KJN95_07370 [Gammaproteobacteria bacterium]|nr:hypothetical protein [Gammaproteobacteria bacterium]
MSHKSLIKILLVVFIFAVSSASLRASNDNNDENGLFEKLMDKLEQKKNVFAFDEAEIIFEQNASDGDIEVVIFAKLEENDAGMQRFWLFGPNGKVVYKFRAPRNNNNIGGREIAVESPEPADITIVKEAYPEGTYTFVAKSFDKDWFLGEADLSHELPDVTITSPIADSSVPIAMFNVTWTAVTYPTEKFLVELGNESSDAEEELLVEIPADKSSFQAPEEWMEADAEYQVSVGIVNEHGNITFRELTVNVTP